MSFGRAKRASEFAEVIIDPQPQTRGTDGITGWTCSAAQPEPDGALMLPVLEDRFARRLERLLSDGESL
ncbi:hypothetical protein [Phyllobacterium endophyticum]|uniref:hypothetical protein n=1 Tax=Phyllobacterium endophyticum TaxID=1149773 RepID=UPI0011C87375|nr:hypothetical protein [Phyllobacterium endophyticum]TXR49431.1 hypothetical protein FVA77_08810 [Phyllobacterium endophyticum]